MKIIIFIIIACTLFVAWSLCIVGASADEQLEMIYAKDLERKPLNVMLYEIAGVYLINTGLMSLAVDDDVNECNDNYL